MVNKNQHAGKKMWNLILEFGRIHIEIQHQINDTLCNEIKFINLHLKWK